MNGEYFEPSPELQAEIDEALAKRACRDPSWSPGAGIVLDPEAIAARARVTRDDVDRVMASSVTALSLSAANSLVRSGLAARDFYYGAGWERPDRVAYDPR